MSSTGCTILGSAVLTLFLAGYLAQRYLPPPKPKIVGIDLGTTFSCIGAYQAGTGEVNILEDKLGRKCIPSIVAFNGKDILVGHAAAEQAEHNPQNTVYDAKRFIGKGFTDEELQKEVGRYPFQMVISEDGMIRYQVHHADENGNKEMTPEVIGSHILRQLKETAEHRLDAKVHRTVISVPAEFDEQQRNYTRKAAELAGFDVLRIITEPTAAALAYGLHKKSGIRNVLVVDLGGGTLDVSLLNIQGGMFLTQAIAGNNHLGGQDFNQRLMSHVLQQIADHFHRQLTDPEDMQALRLAVEDTKQNLTYHDTATLSLHIHSFHGKVSPSTEPIHYELNIDRRTFENINSDLFDKVLEPIDRVLEATELPREDVDEIVLVGGSTRIPKVRRLIREYFGKIPNTSIEPELAVVMGSSLQAGVIGGMWPLTVSAIEQRSPVLKKIHVQ